MEVHELRPPQDPEVQATMRQAVELADQGRGARAAELAYGLWRRLRGDKFVDVWAGQMLAKHGGPEQAVEVYCSSEGSSREIWEGYWQLGHMLLSWGERPRALGFLQEAVRIEPRAIDAHLDLARCLADLGRHAESEARLEQARALDPAASL